MPGGYLRDRLFIRHVPSEYSPVQTREYLEAIGWGSLPSEGEIADGKFEKSVEVLGEIMRKHLLRFPWENTGMHYTQDHLMDVSPQGAFDQLVRKAKGSYCFGMNQVFLGILRALGFRAYGGAARVNQNWSKLDLPPVWTSHTHMVVFVQPEEGSNETYMVDVGFGSAGLIRPIPLVEGDASIVEGVGPTEMHRLGRAAIAQSALVPSLDHLDKPSGQELWTLQVWQGKKADVGKHTAGPWKTLYTFSELEYFSTDRIDGSFVVEQSRAGLFAGTVMCVKVFEEEKEQDGKKMYRMVVFGNQLKKQADGEEEVLKTYESELERVRALREVFGLGIEDEATEYIKGRLSALR